MNNTLNVSVQNLAILLYRFATLIVVDTFTCSLFGGSFCDLYVFHSCRISN